MSTVEAQRRPAQGAPAASSSRVAALDGIRGVAVLYVLGYHAHYAVFRGGFLGVDIFFVLSGFLITQGLVARLDDSDSVWRWYGSFLYRRAARLLPVLLVVIAGLGLATVAFGPSKDQDKIGSCTLASLGDVMNLPFAQRLSCSGQWHVTWSLAAEEQFYFLWPLLLWWALALGRGQVKRHQVRLAGFVMALLYGLSLLWQSRLKSGHATTNRILYSPDGRSLVILLGCTIALFVISARPRPPFPGRTAFAETLGVVGLVALVWAVHSYPRGGTWAPLVGTTVTGLATGALIVAVVMRPTGLVQGVFRLPGLGAAGRMSYSLYLTHECANRLAELLAQSGTVAGELLRWTFTAALGIGAYHLVERPAQARLTRSGGQGAGRRRADGGFVAGSG